jgi:hypothetical protein
MSEKANGNIVMYRTVNWQEEIAAIAGPYSPNDTRESWLNRAARKSGATYWHCKALFYGELTDPKYSVAYKVLSAAEKARAKASQLASRFETIAGALNAADPDFHSHSVLELVNAARALRGLDSA